METPIFYCRFGFRVKIYVENICIFFFDSMIDGAAIAKKYISEWYNKLRYQSTCVCLVDSLNVRRLKLSRKSNFAIMAVKTEEGGCQEAILWKRQGETLVTKECPKSKLALSRITYFNTVQILQTFVSGII